MFGFAIRQIKKRKLMPRISDTERAALTAGDVWVEGELFSGKPNWGRILAEAYPKLTAEEQAFVDGPVEEVCSMVDDWEVYQTKELPQEVWSFLKKHNFFGLAIPKEHGGYGFGALACSSVYGKLGMHSMALSSVVLIPNSIGPAELIHLYGTDEQKEYFLPRLATGEEMPCFALTEPRAGSDAASITSHGVLFKGDDGELHIKLSFEKRYITLAPITTLIGLAFRLSDPDNLLGKGTDVGITCGLVDASLPGVETGRHHDPMGIPFPNGPLKGKNVVIPVNRIIGGVDYAGKGWAMLMEALSGGRAISLPSGATAGVKALARGVGAYAAVRKQFGMPIGVFEGIEEPLARIGGRAYLMEATRVFTCGAVDSGSKPAVASAIAKYNTTELARMSANDGMDVMGGKAICRGPRNPLLPGYMSAPIGITVEGANILTRTLITFGQGALRCHPFMLEEIEAIEAEDPVRLRKAMFGHIAHVVRNRFRSWFLSLTRGVFARSPVRGPERRYYKKLTWASARFAYLADLAVAGLGPKLKAKGKLAGRFADVLSWMYIATATLRRYHEEGRRAEDLPLLDWSLQHALQQIQIGFEGIYRNFEFPLVGWWFRGPASWMARINPISLGPSDQLGHKIARILQTPGSQRDRLTTGLLSPSNTKAVFGVLNDALEKAVEAAPIEAKIVRAARKKKIAKGTVADMVEAAQAADIITEAEGRIVLEADALRTEVLTVDDYSHEEWVAAAPVPARRSA